MSPFTVKTRVITRMESDREQKEQDASTAAREISKVDGYECLSLCVFTAVISALCCG